MRLSPLLFGLVLGLSLANATRAAGSLDEWRVKAAETRTLAENDTPRAYEQAQRLQATLPADAPSTDHARALNLLARAETYLGMTEQAAGHAHQALDLARRNGDAAGQAEADLTLALTSVNLAKLDELVAVTTHSITVLDGVDRPDLLGESLLRAGMMYRRVGLIDEAVRVSVQAMEIARRSKAPLVLAYAHQGMAIAFVQSDRAREAHDHFVQMQAQARAAHSRLIEGDALAGLAGVENTLGDPQAAESHYRDAIAVFREVGAPLSANFGIVSLAQMLRDQHRTAEAAALFDAAIATYERLSTWIGLWYALNGRSTNFQLQGNIAAAFADAERAYDLARKIDFPLYLSESARRMAELSAVKGDHRRAYELAVLAAEMTAKAAREKTSARMVELVRRYEDESRRREIQELTRRNQEQAAALQRHALEQRWLWTVLVGSVALFAGAAFVLIRLRSLNAGLEQRVQARTSELRQQTRYLRALIDTLPLSVWLKDTQSRYLAANRANAEACGHLVDEMVGKSDFDLWPQPIAEAHRAGDTEVMATRQRKTLEESVANGNGTRWMETFRAPVVDEDGSLLGTVGATHDISERKASEHAREAALTEANRLARLRSEFLAQMSHELRTPLNGILGHAALLRTDKTLSDRQSAGINVIQQSGEHLLRLINDVLNLAKIEAGKLELSLSDVALEKFLRSIASIVSIKAELKRLTFSLQLEPGLPAGIRVDEQRLRQVLLNLLANAITFTDRGSVCLRVCALSDTNLRFEVRDTGIGISAHHLDAIFQPFEQVADNQHRAGGTGLGLPISQKYVRLMGSQIEVESQPGQGSTFRFDLELPVVSTAAVAEEETAARDVARPAWTIEPLITPPAPELADLHHLAQQGNMRDIVSWARRVIELDGRRYGSFADHVRRLAESYESQAILTLVREHLRKEVRT